VKYKKINYINLDTICKAFWGDMIEMCLSVRCKRNHRLRRERSVERLLSFHK